MILTFSSNSERETKMMTLSLGSEMSDSLNAPSICIFSMNI